MKIQNGSNAILDILNGAFGGNIRTKSGETSAGVRDSSLSEIAEAQLALGIRNRGTQSSNKLTK